MITNLVTNTFSNYDGSVQKTITFTNADSSEYVVKNIDGLGPVKVTQNTFSTPFDPGLSYLSSQAGERNIVLTIGFNPNYAANSSPASLRRSLIPVFTPGKRVRLTITDDLLGDRWIEGWVESHDPTIFSAEPTVLISVMCVDPYFHGTSGTVEVVPVFTSGTNITLTNLGDVNVGFIWNYTINTKTPGTLYNPVLTQRGVKGNRASWSTLRGSNAKDIWHFSSQKGTRGLSLTRAGVTTSQLGYIAGNLTDMVLEPGDNLFFYAPTDLSYIASQQFFYEPLYESL